METKNKNLFYFFIWQTILLAIGILVGLLINCEKLEQTIDRNNECFEINKRLDTRYRRELVKNIIAE